MSAASGPRRTTSSDGQSGLEASNPGFAAGVLAAVVSFAAVASSSWLAAGAAGLGALALAVGGRRGERSLVRAGSVGLGAGTVLAGVAGAAPLGVGLGAWSALVAWDATTHALSVAAQVPAATDDWIVLAHVRDATLVGGAGLVIAAGAFLVGTSGSVALAGIAAVAAVVLVLALALS